MILFYSGTGNSRYIAEEAAKQLGDNVTDLNMRIKNNDLSPLVLEEKDQERLIISVPTYAWRIPRIVENWLIKVKPEGVKKIWFIMTCGDETGIAGMYNKKLCNVLGAQYMGTAPVIMPENYVAMFKVPKDHTARKIIANAVPSIEKVISLIKEDRPFPAVRYRIIDHIYSRIVNPLFYSFFVKAKDFTADDKCMGCGKCSDLCPLNNITIKNKKPVWGDNCTHCMACICRCPAKAIEYGKKSLGKPRYYNPYV